MTEKLIFQAIRAGQAKEVWGMLIRGEAQIGDKSKDGVSVYDLVMASDNEVMKSLVREHMVAI